MYLTVLVLEGEMQTLGRLLGIAGLDLPFAMRPAAAGHLLCRRADTEVRVAALPEPSVAR